MNRETQLVMYTTQDGLTKVEATFEGDTVWLTLCQIAELFQRDKSTISRHIKNIFEEGELRSEEVSGSVATTAADGKVYQVTYYNLDMVLAIGYRVKSPRGTQFRVWAGEVLKEYMLKGFAMDDERLKGNGGGAYWKELLNRIRDIRSSEKVLYRQVLDLYATSVDYDPRSEESVCFFKMVQNKLHFAAHGHTAAEVVYKRADADRPFMGLKTFAGDLPVLKDVCIAKNYLDETELKVLNNLVSGYFDFAELSAIEHRPMYMHDYVRQLDTILSANGRPLLQGSGTVSHAMAAAKARDEYRKFQVRELSPVERDYVNTLKLLAKEAKKQVRSHPSDK